jgi:hypothetical protein
VTTTSRVASFLNVAGVLLYGLGLVSPLTPSEGMPNVPELFVFAACPIAFLFVSLFLSRTRAARAVTVVEITGIVGLTTWLLWLQARTS